MREKIVASFVKKTVWFSVLIVVIAILFGVILTAVRTQTVAFERDATAMYFAGEGTLEEQQLAHRVTGAIENVAVIGGVLIFIVFIGVTTLNIVKLIKELDMQGEST
jgi:hypothetical protein